MKAFGLLLRRCLREIRFAVATFMRLVGMEAEGARFRGGRLLRKLSLMLGGRNGLIGGLRGLLLVPVLSGRLLLMTVVLQRRLLLVTVLLRRVLLAGRLLIVSWRRRRRQLAMILTSLSRHGWQAGRSIEKALAAGTVPSNGRQVDDVGMRRIKRSWQAPLITVSREIRIGADPPGVRCEAGVPV
jgi:hypothetical protein